MNHAIKVSIDSRTLERLLREQQLRLDEISCQDGIAQRQVHDLLLQVIKSQLFARQ